MFYDIVPKDDDPDIVQSRENEVQRCIKQEDLNRLFSFLSRYGFASCNNIHVFISYNSLRCRHL